MDWNDVKPVLVRDREYSYVVPDDFSWDLYLESCGGYASTDPALFSHVQYMDQTLLERACPAGRLVFVNQGENGVRLARIETACIEQLHVEYLNGSYGDRDWVGLDDIVTDTERFHSEYEVLPDKYRTSEFYDVDALAKYVDRIDTPLEDLIKPGQYFEVQDPAEPRKVIIAKIVHNFGGIVIYECVRMPERVLLVNITDNTCHALGWTESGSQNVSFHDIYHDRSFLDGAEHVPNIVFERNPVKRHSMKVGMLLEVHDAGVGTAFYPGHVSEILNEHFFRVTTTSADSQVPLQIVAHSGHPCLHPVGYCSVNRLMLFPPRMLLGKPTNATTEWTWNDYRETYTVENSSSNSDFSNENHFDPAVQKGKIACMRYVEIFCYQQGIMFSGLIVRSYRNTVWILPGHENDPSAVIILKCGSPSLFPCGYAKKYGIPLVGESPFTTLEKLNDDASQNVISGDRFNMARYYRSVPGPIFRKFVYGGRGRPEKKWAFMSESWLKGDSWIPNVYVRRSCYLGVWFDRRMYAAIKDTYPAGPLPQILKLIIKDLFRCTLPAHRNDVLSILSTEEDVPVLAVKYRWRAEHILMRVPFCETAAQFGGWIRMLLRSLGCCPNLLSLDPDIPCEPSCSSIKHTDEKLLCSVPTGMSPLELPIAAGIENTPPSSGHQIVPSARSAINSASSEEIGPKRRRRSRKEGTKDVSPNAPSTSAAQASGGGDHAKESEGPIISSQTLEEKATDCTNSPIRGDCTGMPKIERVSIDSEGDDETHGVNTMNELSINGNVKRESISSTSSASNAPLETIDISRSSSETHPELRRCLETPLRSADSISSEMTGVTSTPCLAFTSMPRPSSSRTSVPSPEREENYTLQSTRPVTVPAAVPSP